MTNQSDQVLAAQTGPFSQNRTGTIASVTDENVIVVVGGTSFAAQALDTGVTLTEGDLVSVLQQNASWFVLGRIIGQGENAVLDSSFEEGIPGSFPDDWEFYDVTGLSSAAVVARDGAPGGDQVLAVTSADAATAVSLAYSAPISVVPGETWNLAAYVGGNYALTALDDADADLVALWFANATDLYPTTSAADTVVASLIDVAQLPPFTGISGSVTVPVGAAVMRVALRSSLVTGQSLEWDLVTARQTGLPTTDTGRGPVNYTRIAAATAGTVAEAIAINTPQIVFKSGRAYRFAIKGVAASTVSGDVPRIRLRITGLAGTTYLDTLQGLNAINGANSSVFFYGETVVVNTGEDITDDLVLTYSRNNGTGNISVGGSAGQPSYIEVTDVGAATSYAGAPVL